jgi:hypothetical protein
MRKYATLSLTKMLVIALAFVSLQLISSCADEKKKETKTDQPERQESKKEATTPALATAAANSFYTLQLDSATLAELLPKAGVAKKLIVQFADSNGTNTGLSLVAYGAKENGTVTTGPKGFTVLSNAPTTFNGPNILGNQELTLKSIKTILGLRKKGGSIDAKDFKSLQFVPLKDGSNHIYYAVTRLGMKEADGAALTNPSPPAPPCENGCDY